MCQGSQQHVLVHGCVVFLCLTTRLFPIFYFYEKLLLCISLTLPPGSQVHTFLSVTHLQAQQSAHRVSVFLTALLRYVLGYAYLERYGQTPSQSCFAALHHHKPCVSFTSTCCRQTSFLPSSLPSVPPSLPLFLPSCLKLYFFINLPMRF